MEETLSTLDYALRAKSIRNKPEVNQRMTRNALLKEYVTEIERLKSDLLAAREKNGIFFSEETWNQMTMEQELRSTELEEAKKQVEIVENQMRAVREEFEQSIGLLKMREGELSETREKLKDVEFALGRKEEELVLVKGALEEEVVMRKAHHDSEVTLDGVAVGLRNVAQESVRDVSELLQKLGEYFVDDEKRCRSSLCVHRAQDESFEVQLACCLSEREDDSHISTYVITKA